VPNENLINRTRLTTGLILFSYVSGHLLDHATGVISVAAMQSWLRIMLAIWSNPVGTTALYGALLIHMALALTALWRRRSLRMPAMEAAQLSLGFLVPLVLAQHVANTVLTYRLYGVGVDYNAVLLKLYVLSPVSGLAQAALLIAAWTHGCIGLNYNFRRFGWYAQGKWPLFALALWVPLLALLGFYEGGREVAVLAQDPAWVAMALPHPLPAGAAAHLDMLGQSIRAIVLALLAAVLIGRVVRRQLQLRKGAVVITYPDGRKVRVVGGTSVLEASRNARIPHASICGGRGRCSTCRIRVVGRAGTIPAPDEAEIGVLRGIRAPPNVRLACQLRPTGDVQVTPLLPADISAREGFGKVMDLAGSELEIAVLFCDIRSFTRLAEHMLPFDVVFLLNRYFAEMGRAVEEAGGRVDKFIGDGVMALFGVDRGPQEGCRAALVAARAMSDRLDQLNATLSVDLQEPIRVGIGLHVGRAIVGSMGYGHTVTVTAIGDAVNAASRLEAETKILGVELVVSDAVARRAGIDLGAFPLREIDLRGRQDAVAVRIVSRAKELPVVPEIGLIEVPPAGALAAEPA
jgi:adenylate cyclase